MQASFQLDQNKGVWKLKIVKLMFGKENDRKFISNLYLKIFCNFVQFSSRTTYDRETRGWHVCLITLEVLGSIPALS